MKPQMKQYGVWRVEENEDAGFWLMFDSIEDAVSSEGPSEVFELSSKSLGQFEVKAIVRKLKVKKLSKKSA